MPDRALVTGISGFIGGHVALRLLADGYVVRGSVRDIGKADKVRATLAQNGADTSRLEFVALDLLRDEGWSKAMTDVRFVHHVASPFVTRLPKDRMRLVRPAVEGTRRAIEAAFAGGVERVVLTSSLAAVMYGYPRERAAPFGAGDWSRLDGPGVNAYIESKTRAEQTAWDIAAAMGRRGDLAVVNPGFVLGTLLDDDPGTSATIVVRLLNGSLPAVARISMVVIDIGDVAELHLKAMSIHEAGGRRFPAGAATMSLREMSDSLRSAFPEFARRLPRFEVPDWIVRPFGWADADLRGNVDELGYVRHVDAQEAAALLGRPFVPAEEAVVEAGRSAIANGLIRR